MYVCVCVHAYVCMRTCACVCVCLCACMWCYVCVNTGQLTFKRFTGSLRYLYILLYTEQSLILLLLNSFLQHIPLEGDDACSSFLKIINQSSWYVGHLFTKYIISLQYTRACMNPLACYCIATINCGYSFSSFCDCVYKPYFKILKKYEL